MVTIVLEMTADHLERVISNQRVRVIVAQYDSEGPFELTAEVDPLAVRLVERKFKGLPPI